MGALNVILLIVGSLAVIFTAAGLWKLDSYAQELDEMRELKEQVKSLQAICDARERSGK